MIKAISWCDRVMFLALLVLVIFIPYSSAMIQTSLIIMMLGWQIKHFLMWRSNPQQGWMASYRLPYVSLQWPLIIIGALILLTMPFSQAPALTLKKFFSRFLQQALLMYLVLEIVNKPKRLYQVLGVLLWTLIVANADVFIQYFSGQSFIFSNQLLYGRVAGPMRHPNDLGTLLITVIPVILSLLITREWWISFFNLQRFKGIITALIAVLLALSVIALGLSSSRGAWLAFGVSMLSFGVCLKKPWWTAAILAMLVLFFWGFGTYCINIRTDIAPSERISETVSPQQGEHPGDSNHLSTLLANGEKVLLNASRRDVYWQTALDVIKTYPVFGCGYNAYIQTLKKLKFHPEEYPHNSLLQIGSELGLLGLFAHLCLFVSIFICGIRTLKAVAFSQGLYILGLGLCVGLMAWLIHSFTDTAWESLQLGILWWTMIGLLLSLAPVAKQMNLSHKGGV